MSRPILTRPGLHPPMSVASTHGSRRRRGRNGVRPAPTSCGLRQPPIVAVKPSRPDLRRADPSVRPGPPRSPDARPARGRDRAPGPVAVRGAGGERQDHDPGRAHRLARGRGRRPGRSARSRSTSGPRRSWPSGSTPRWSRSASCPGRSASGRSTRWVARSCARPGSPSSRSSTGRLLRELFPASHGDGRGRPLDSRSRGSSSTSASRRRRRRATPTRTGGARVRRIRAGDRRVAAASTSTTWSSARSPASERRLGAPGPLAATLRELLVDEVQDVDRTQLGSRCSSPRRRTDIFLVGDDDQTIYGWRLADVRRVLDLAARCRACGGSTSTSNYRCPRPVVERAVRLVEHNRERFAKRIHAGPNAVGRLVLAPDADDDVVRRGARWRDLAGRRRDACRPLADEPGAARRGRRCARSRAPLPGTGPSLPSTCPGSPSCSDRVECEIACMPPLGALRAALLEEDALLADAELDAPSRADLVTAVLGWAPPFPRHAGPASRGAGSPYAPGRAAPR